MGLFDIFSTKPAENAAADKIAGLNAAYNQASGALNTGLANATGYYNQALSPWQALSGAGNNAYQLYADAIGANGAEGAARAQQAFTSAPGYQFQVDQAIENADRGAAARGMLSSGGQRANEIGIAQNLANQNYNNWLQSFQPMLSGAQNAAQGMSNVYGQLGQLNYNTGNQLANLGWQQQTGIGDANAASGFNVRGPYGRCSPAGCSLPNRIL